MKLTWKLLVVAALCAIVAFSAPPPNLTNTRPVVIGSPATGEESLQTILDGIYGTGVINANTDQSDVAMWQETGTNPTSAPALKATYAADGDAVGIYSYSGGTLDDIDIFTNTAAVNTAALVQFNSDGTITISGGAGVNSGTFAGINQYDFGFYLQDCGGTTCVSTDKFYYTSDNENPVATPAGNSPNQFPSGYTTQARAVTYVNPVNDRWAIAFEDGTDFDYNDRVISVESIQSAVPEPGAVVLFGTVLVLCASGLRRRKKLV